MPKTILLVEDDESLRRCLSDILSSEGGFSVTAARDGTEALSLVDGGLAFDALLTDRRMPLMGGEQLITELRKRGLRQFMVLMTGDVVVPDRLPGADMVVHKPMSVIELIDVLHQRA